ncbi:MAG: polyprenyl diphosphate synthase [bacterium]|nr:polyprenyl diphosphate synthase [bacterium]
MTDKKIPNHIAIIPDGNRRWAKERGLPTLEGHKKGAEAFVELAKASRKKGIHTLTGWAFSTENWERDITEVRYLMDLFKALIIPNEKLAHEDNVRIRMLGRRDRLPADLLKEIQRVEYDTKDYTTYDLNICLDYGGQNEIIRAMNKLLEEGKKTITEKEFEQYLDTSGQTYPNPDLLIRTSGEQRTSGLMPYQMVYAELYFEPEPMPEFNEEKLDKALEAYANRDRRFGGNTAKK